MYNDSNNNEWHWEPLMFWQDITYVLTLIVKIFKKIFGINTDPDNGTSEQ